VTQPLTLKSEGLVGPGDCVVNLPDAEPHPYYFVVARTGNELIAIRLRTGKWGLLRPTRRYAALDTRNIVIIIGRPNTWSAKLTEADYERLAARANTPVKHQAKEIPT
jgi:hypothetical protein